MMTEEHHLANALTAFIGRPLDNPLTRSEIMETARIALAALAQPASPALKLPDGWVAVPREATREMIESGWTYSVLEKNATAKGTWACMVAAAPAVPHTAPIEPICATGGAEWVSNERVEEIIYRTEMLGHGAGYLPDEVIPLAKELLALRKAFTQPIVWIHQTTGAKLNNSVIEDARKQSGVWIPLYRKPNLPL
jgi:hypothetical protein